MKKVDALATIRGLSQVGLPPEQFIPALLESMHRVIPSSRNLFDWTDEQGNLIRYYFEGQIDHDIARLYFDEFHNRRELEAMPGFTQSVTGHATVRSAAELDNESFFRSALYNEIWKPQGLHSRIEAIVRGARGLPLGSLVLYRAPRERAFSRDDEELLGTLAPYVARGLEGHATLPTDYVTRRDRRGVITLGADGQLRQLSAQAHKLLLLAHGGIRRSTAATAPRREDFPTLTYLYQQYWRDGAQTTVTNGTSLRVENDWGQFVFEAERLNGVGGVPSMLTVTVHHLEPESAAARRGVDALPVSVSQREVCALLYAGLSQGEIARKLSIAPSTVADHVKRIYNRLDVHSVAELAQRIDRGAATHT